MILINPQNKLLWHLEKIVEWKHTGSTGPLLFEIDPSNKCNHDCPWCSFAKLRGESKDVMCYETAKKMLDSMKAMGVKAITWTGGGEPLMNKRIVEMIEYAQMLKLEQGMFTNGMLLNKRMAPHVVKKLDWIRFSVDGYDAKSYAKNHGTSEKAFDLVIENIKAACSQINRAVIGFGYIITESNYDGIETVTKIARDCKTDYIHFKPVTYRPYQTQISTDVVKKFYEKATEMKKYETDKFKVVVSHYRFQDMMNSENRGRGYKKCYSHCIQGAIGADEKVYFCDHHKGEKEYELGDLKKNSLEEIWTGQQRRDVIDFVNSTDLSQCMDCCRNHEANKMMWDIKNKGLHPNHI